MVEGTRQKKIIAVLLAFSCMLMASLISCSDHFQDDPAFQGDIKNMTAYLSGQLWRGINIGGALEAPSPGEWGVTIEAPYFKEIRNAGFNSVRIPIRFSAYADEQVPYQIDSAIFNDVDEAVSLAMNEGLNVIINLHHYDSLMSDPMAHLDRFLAIWGQISIHYQASPENLIFELLNEPTGKLDPETWNEYASQAIERIRCTNPDRRILVGGIDFNRIEALDLLVLPDDNNLIATFHFYEPFNFTHQGADWVQDADSWKGTIWHGTNEEQKAIQHQLDRAAAWSSDRGIPIVMGEFGVIRNADAASRERWMHFLIQESEKRGISWIIWDFCGDFGIYDCSRGAWDINPGSIVSSESQNQ